MTTQGFDTLVGVIDPTDYLRLVLDPVRLAVLGAAAVGPVEADSLAAGLNVPVKSVLRAIVKLQGAGLLDPERRFPDEPKGVRFGD